MSGVQHIEITENDADQRLDRFLKRRFPQVTQGMVEKFCRKGELRLDGGRVKSNTRVQAGQSLRVPPLPEGQAPAAPRKDAVSDADAQMMRAAVIYQDDHIIALNKPPGLPCQGGSKQTRHVDGLSVALAGEGDKPRLVHRLDKDTSGVLLMARTRAVAAGLTNAFRARSTRKIYWAAVAGCPSPELGTIRYGLVKMPGHGRAGENEKMRCVHPREVDEVPGAKRAVTDYALLDRLGSRAAWLAMVPVTGRTHQLRAHIAEMGHPIIGDGKYGGSSQENLGDGWGAGMGGEISRKLHLHARQISFEHPVTGKKVTIRADLPEHMQRTWDLVNWQANAVPEDPFEDLM